MTAGSGVIHCDKIIFRPVDGTQIRCPFANVEPSGPNLDFRVYTPDDRLEVKVLDEDTSKMVDLRAKAARFLRFRLDCDRNAGPGPVITRSEIHIIDVEYIVIP